jgi:hypothetical protein
MLVITKLLRHLIMAFSVHNPDQYMASLRQIVGQGRKRVALLVGAGVPAGLPSPSGTGPLIPAAAGLTTDVLGALAARFGTALDAIKGAVAMCVGICWRGLRWDEDTGSGSQVNRLFSKVLV